MRPYTLQMAEPFWATSFDLLIYLIWDDYTNNVMVCILDILFRSSFVYQVYLGGWILQQNYGNGS